MRREALRERRRREVEGNGAERLRERDEEEQRAGFAEKLEELVEREKEKREMVEV